VLEHPEGILKARPVPDRCLPFYIDGSLCRLRPAVSLSFDCATPYFLNAHCALIGIFAVRTGTMQCEGAAFILLREYANPAHAGRIALVPCPLQRRYGL